MGRPSSEEGAGRVASIAGFQVYDSTKVRLQWSYLTFPMA
jgi:hypothetical protein